MHTSPARAIPIRSLFAAAVLACCAAAQAQWVQPAPQPGAAPTALESQNARFREAMRLHRIGRWSAAYGRFAALADEGHVPASRVALEMLRHGRDVYGMDWSAAPTQVVSWQRSAGARGETTVATMDE